MLAERVPTTIVLFTGSSLMNTFKITLLPLVPGGGLFGSSGEFMHLDLSTGIASILLPINKFQTIVAVQFSDGLKCENHRLSTNKTAIVDFANVGTWRRRTEGEILFFHKLERREFISAERKESKRS